MVQCFFDFFIPLSCKTPTFESFFGRLPARKALKSRCFSWEGYQKVKKTSGDSSDFKKPVFLCSFWTFLSQMLRGVSIQLLRRPAEAVDVRVSSGGALRGPGRARGGSIYRKTPDQPPQRPLCLWCSIPENNGSHTLLIHLCDARSQKTMGATLC